MSRDLKLSLWDAFFFSLMVGIGESYLPAFALASGLSATLTGLFSTIPLAIGATVQLLTPWALKRVGSLRRWVVIASFLQAFSLLPFAFWKEFEMSSPIYLFIAAAFYWGAGFAASPAWNRWMTDIVPASQSDHFFARRLRIIQYGTMLGLLCGGAVLKGHFEVGYFSSAFALTFLIAFGCRMTSGVLLWNKPDRVANLKNQIGVWNLARRLSEKHYERNLLAFLFLFNFTLFISSPFVNPFLLDQLRLDFQFYTLALIGMFVGKIMGYTVTHRYLGKLVSERVLVVGAFGISPLPALWMFCDHILSISLLQLASGLFWGVYESALAMILFRRLNPDSKVATLSMMNFVQCVAMLGGSLFGGLVLKSNGEVYFAYILLFSVSAFSRLLVACGFSFWWVGWPFKARSCRPVEGHEAGVSSPRAS